MEDDNRKDRILEGLLGRIAAALEDIAQKLGVLVTPSEPNNLQVKFGQPVPKTKEKLEMSSSPFNAPNIDMVPYDVEALDATGAVVPLTATQVLTLTSANANAIVVPNSTDATGATGNIVAAAGFVGPVSGAAGLTDSANPGFSLAGTWSGQFDASVTEPISLAVVFGAPVPKK